MVSSPVPPPVMKSVDDALAVQDAASRARSSVTVTGPSVPVMVVSGLPEPRATLTDDLGGLLDDASYNHDAHPTGGSVSYTSPVLTWTGNLDPGQAVVITFSVTVSNPDTGDQVMVNTAVSAVTGSNCLAGSTDPACTATVTC